MSINLPSAMTTFATVIRYAHLWKQSIWSGKSYLPGIPALDDDARYDLGVTHECGTAYCFAGFHATRAGAMWHNRTKVGGSHADYFFDSRVILPREEGFEYASYVDETYIRANTLDREALRRAFGDENGRMPELMVMDISEWAQQDLGLRETNAFESVNSLELIFCLLMLELLEPQTAEGLIYDFNTDDSEEDYTLLISRDPVVLQAVAHYVPGLLTLIEQVISTAKNERGQARGILLHDVIFRLEHLQAFLTKYQDVAWSEGHKDEHPFEYTIKMLEHDEPVAAQSQQ